MDKVYTADELSKFVFLGAELAHTEASKLEQLLTNEPGNVENRFVLLGYYFARRLDSRFKERRRLKHVHWCIEHFFESPFLCQTVYAVVRKPENPTYYDQSLGVWLKILDGTPNSAQAHINFAWWLSFSDVTLAEKMLAKARLLDPLNQFIEPTSKRIEFSKTSRI